MAKLLASFYGYYPSLIPSRRFDRWFATRIPQHSPLPQAIDHASGRKFALSLLLGGFKVIFEGVEFVQQAWLRAIPPWCGSLRFVTITV
jgi:hypothetical protein